MDNKSEKENVRQILTEYLQKNGHRKTPERFAILDTIYSIKGHFDIDRLYEIMLNEENFRVSKATLYNTIILLLDAGLIIKHQFGTTSQYERSFNQETHHHLICTYCGKVSEFHDDNIQASIAGASFRRFHMNQYSLYIYGICSSCAAQLTRKRKKLNNKSKQ